MIKNCIIPLHVYPFDIMISIAETDEEFRKSIVKNSTPELLKDLEEDNNASILTMRPNNQGRTVHLTEGGQTIIRITNKINLPEHHGTLAHEIFHAVEFILNRIRIKLTMDSDEAFAYLIGYVTKEIYSKFKIK